MTHKEQVKKQRKEKDHYVATHPQSPLTPEQKRDFKGLNYFPVNEELRFDPVEVEVLQEKELFEMQTNTGQIQRYLTFGKAKFTVQGKKLELMIYTNPQIPDYYFVPFWDLTVQSGETYGAGRYLELDRKADDTFVLDFNKAYNPYCAYNERWTCPLTPPDNRLEVRVEAGEKVFHAKE